MRAQQERQYDDYERMATEATFVRQAYHAKKLKPTDLFKRPSGKEKAGRMSAKELREYTEQQQAILSQFTFTKSNG